MQGGRALAMLPIAITTLPLYQPQLKASCSAASSPAKPGSGQWPQKPTPYKASLLPPAPPGPKPLCCSRL